MGSTGQSRFTYKNPPAGCDISVQMESTRVQASSTVSMFMAQNVPKMCTHKTYILKMKISLWPSSAFSILRSSAQKLRSPIMNIDSCRLLFHHRMACL